MTQFAAAGSRKKRYRRPQVIKMSSEQGKLVLVGRAWNGDQNARDLLKLVFPNPFTEKAKTR